MIYAYNSTKSGDDMVDQIISIYSTKRKVYKWWKSIFYYLLDIKILNASVLFYQQNEIRKKIYVLKCFISDKI